MVKNSSKENFNIVKDRIKNEGDYAVENSLRPTLLDDFVGQKLLKDNLKVFIESSKINQESLDHVLFYGPPGLGKTTLSHIIANELGVDFKSNVGSVLSKAGDLASILSSLTPNSVLFIDEIHRLNPAVEEILYSAMEDFKLDIVLGQGVGAQTLKISLPKFTLIGATTRLGLVSNPLRDRFLIQMKLNFYDFDELQQMVERDAKVLNIRINEKGSKEIARRSRGTPRIAIRLLKRVRDFAVVAKKQEIDEEIANLALERLNVDDMGLDESDRKYLNFIIKNYDGGPVGIDTLSAGLSEEKDSIEDKIEPYLIQCGFINKTPRGRVATRIAYNHLNIKRPNGSYNSEDDITKDLKLEF